MKIKYTIIFSYISIMTCIINANFKEIYVFGDSHVFYSFHDFTIDFSKFIAPTNVESLFRYKQNLFKFIIRPSIATTMYRVGRDQTKFLDLRNLGINNCVVLFNFGEVDCRCHIGKQVIEKKRKIEEVIEALVQNYIKFIKLTQKQVANLIYVVIAVIPPTDIFFNPDAPRYGSLENRVSITNMLNEKLQKECFKSDIIFLDPYTIFRDQDGTLILEFSDRVVHVNPNINYFIKEYILSELEKFLI